MDKFCNKIPYALDISTGEYIEVNEYSLNNKGKICCPYCMEGVIFRGARTYNKDGTLRKKHYSHKPNGVCVNKVSNEGESIEHKESKEYIFNLLKSLTTFSPDFEIIKLSKEFQFIDEDLNINRIADVYIEFTYKDDLYKQAYEIQYSNITEEEFVIRHNDYKKLGIEDIWFVGLQYKEKKKSLKSVQEEEFYSDDGCKFIGDIEDFYYRDEDLQNRPFLRRLNSGLNFNKKPIHKKSISLYNKVSSFQNNVYLISTNGLYLPKTIDTNFIGAESKNYNDDSLFFKLEDLNYYKENKKSPYSFGMNFDEYYTLKLSHTKTIGDYHLYNHNLINIHKQELNEDFFINGDNKLFHMKNSELKYAELKIDELRSIEAERKKIELFEENINKYKYTQNEYAKIYLIRLITKFVLSANGVIENNKTSVRRKTSDSLQWINKTLLTQEWKDKNKYGFFSSINKVLENMSHIIPNIFIHNSSNLIESVKNIINFLDNVECDFYEGVDYKFFMEQFNNSLYKDLCRSNNYEENTFKGLNEQFFYYGIRTVFKGYCLSEVKGDVNLFMYKSIFGNNKNDLENRFRKEYNELIELNNEIKEIYISN